MPDFDLLLDDDPTPLFTDEDPLTFTMPDPETGALRRYHAIDQSIFPDDRGMGLNSQPRTFMVEMMCMNVIDDERSELRKQLHTLFDDGLLTVEKLTELIDWLNDQRDKARKKLAKRKLHRPTGGPPPSSRSSSTGPAISAGDSYSGAPAPRD